MADLMIFMLIWGVWILIPIIVDGAETLLRLGVIIWSRLHFPEKPIEIEDKDLPNITVVIPAYNEEKIINRAIASIKIQDYPQDKLEIVVIDDGSTDYTVKRIINYSTGRSINGNGNGKRNGNGNGKRNGNGNGNGNGQYKKRLAKLIADGYANGTVKINGHQYDVPDFQGGIKLLASDYHLGKPEALNTAIESTNGYGDIIITVDSDVVLEKDALKETAKAFAANPEMGAATCNIEVSWQNMSEIDDEGNPILDKKGQIVTRKLSFWEGILAKCQFLEYVDSFCLGREFQSRVHSAYILAGAYSAFRKDVLKKIYYREATLTEDFDLTVDIHKMNYYIGYVCRAKAYLEPVIDWDHLYSQRVRWHRGQLEVSGLHKEMIGNRRFGKMGWLGFPQMLLGDHTLSFPRLIWTPLILFFGLFGYPFNTIMMAMLLMYAFYVTMTMMQTGVAYLYVNKDSRGHVEDTFFVCFLMPFYRLATFYFRMSGYLLALKEPPRWQVTGPMNGLKNGINGFKNGIANGVADVKNGFNGYGNGGKKKVKEVNNGFANGYNGIRNGFYILQHGFKGFFTALKVHQHRKPVYNNGVNPKTGLRNKDKPDIRVLQQARSQTKVNQKEEKFDLNKAFPRIKPPVAPYPITLSPRNMESYLSEAYYYLHRESFEQAQIPFDEAVQIIEKTSDLGFLHLELAKSLFYSGDNDRAWAHLKQAAIITHDDKLKKQIRETIKVLPQEYHEPDANSMVVAAYDHLDKGEIYEARDCFRKAIELTEDVSDMAFLRLQISRTYYLADEKQSALEDFQVAKLINKEFGEKDRNIEELEETFFNGDATHVGEIIEQGNKAFNDKDYTQAREYFKKALAKSKDLGQLVFLELAIAKTYLLSNRFEQTKEHLNRAAVLDPKVATHPEYASIEKSLPASYRNQSHNYLIDQAYSSMDEGQFAKARTLFKLALEKADDIETLILCYLELGRLFYLSSQMRKARLNLNNALILCRGTNRDELTSQIEAIIENVPKYYVKDALGSLTKESYRFINEGQYDKARICISKGFALAKDITDLIVLRTELGKVYGYAKQFKKANKELKEALLLASVKEDRSLKNEIKSLLAQFPAGAEVSYDILVGQGYNYLSRNNYKKAEKSFVDSVSYARTHHELILSYLEIARIKKMQHDLDEAQLILSNALNLANILKMTDYIRAEIESAMELVKADKRSINLNKAVNKAYEQLQKRNYGKARAHISQAFAHADSVDSIIVARMELGRIYALSGQYKRATVELNIALKLASEAKKEKLAKEIKSLLANFPTTSANFEALMKKGEMLLRNGKPVRAQRIFERGAKIAHTPEELLRLYLAQGQAKIAGKDNEQGKRDLAKALILSQEYGKINIVREINNLLMAS